MGVLIFSPSYPSLAAFVDIGTVSNFYNQHDEFLILNSINYPVYSLSYSIAILT